MCNEFLTGDKKDVKYQSLKIDTLTIKDCNIKKIEIINCIVNSIIIEDSYLDSVTINNSKITEFKAINTIFDKSFIETITHTENKFNNCVIKNSNFTVNLSDNLFSNKLEKSIIKVVNTNDYSSNIVIIK